MKKLLLALALFLAPVTAFAQCNGVFPASTACGSVSGGVPGQVPFSSIGNAPGAPSGSVQYNNSGIFTGNAGLTYSAGNALVIAPTALTNNSALNITNSTPAGGSVAGPINLNVITVTDGTQTVTGTVDSFGQIANRTTGLQINHLVTGGSANHFAIDGIVKATATNGGIVGIVGGTRTETGGVSTGNMWGVIGYGQVAGNSTFNQSMIGVDAEVGIATGSTARDRIGVGSVAFGSVAGTTTDASFMTYLDTTELSPFNGAAPFKIGWYLSNNFLGAATFPIDTIGDVIKADTGTVTNFVNAPLLTVSGNILSFPNVQLTGSGNLRLFNTNSSGAFVVSPNSGATNTSFQVDNSLGQGNGIYIFTTVAGSGANITTISTTTNEGLNINARGTSPITLGNTSTGGVGIINTAAKTKLDVNVNSASSPALIVATSIMRLQAADTVSGGFETVSYGAGSGAGNIIAGAAAGGTAASPTATANTSYMFNMRGYGYNSGFQLGGLWIIAASELWAAGHQGTQQQWFTTPNASTTIAQAMELYGSGGLSMAPSGTPIADPGNGNIAAARYFSGTTGGLASKSCLFNTSNVTTGITLTITGGLVTGTTTC